MDARLLDARRPGSVERAVGHLRSGGVLGLPTETVYGLAAALHDPLGVARIVALKGRPDHKPLPWQVADLSAAEAAGFGLEGGARRLAEAFWPGPLTLVLRRPEGCPAWFSPSSPTVALRVPRHEVALAVLSAWGRPLAVTSANRSGGTECLTAEALLRAFPEASDLLVLDGGTASGSASTVVDATGAEPRIFREGPLSRARIEEVWNATD